MLCRAPAACAIAEPLQDTMHTCVLPVDRKGRLCVCVQIGRA